MDIASLREGNVKLKHRVAALAAAATVIALAPMAQQAQANTPVPHAAFTTTNNTDNGGPDPTGQCQNGNELVNCNIYTQKQYVWLNGGPVAAQLDDGNYFFAVLVPGGQGGNENPNDCTDKNLSDNAPCDTSLTPGGDVWTNREFSISGGDVSYSGTHDFTQANNKIRLFPYDNTTNPGGVYILAICSLADATNTGGGELTQPPGVDPSDCKYDAFKVNGEGTVPAADRLVIEKDAAGSYKTTYTWGIEKCTNVGQDCLSATTVQKTGGTATFTYTVHVTHDAGTTSDVKVTGKIQVFNPNVDDQSNVVPVDIDGVTDQLSDGTDCTVTDGGPQTLTTFETDFLYSCDLSSVPDGQLDNTAEVTWSSQLLDNGAFLVGSSADKTFTDVNFTNTPVHDCTTVTDPVPSGGTSNDNPFPATVCVGDSGPPADGGAGTGASDGFTFVYHVTYNVTAGCHDFTNTATESTDGNSDSVTVTVCGPEQTSALTIGFWKTTNGQNLIKTYSCPSGKTSLASYLAGLGPTDQGPFSNATGCGTTMANYVSNILKGATATNMNIMLRAQMLGTALDVYFSDPAMGYTSTKIGSIKPPSVFLTNGSLGGFNMDLTAICPMIDNTSTGTATCKNNTPSTDGHASGAFNADCLTVQQVLDFESTLPPFNGSTSAPVWYAGNRTKEEIAKNTFDQINNRDAFAC